MSASDSLPERCQVCGNTFTLLANAIATERRCPYCQSVVWPEKEQPALESIGEFHYVQPVEHAAPAVVYSALRDDKRYLITLLDSGDHLYSAKKLLFEHGRTDPYGPDCKVPHPNMVQAYPIDWADKVAIASIDYFDGATLGDWLDVVRSIPLADAVHIALCCIRVSEHVDAQGTESTGLSKINPSNIQILENGELKVTCFAESLIGQFKPELQTDLSTEELMRRAENERVYSEHYGSPNFDPLKANEYSEQQIRSQKIYGLGCLLFELLSGQSCKISGFGEKPSLKSELVWSLNKRLVEVPDGLRKVVKKMTAVSQRHRYSQYADIIEDLEALRLNSERCSFCEGGIAARRSKAPAPAYASFFRGPRMCVDWVHKTDASDFRHICWGMSMDEVKAIEPEEASLDLPTVAYTVEYKSKPLLLIYQFAELAEGSKCIAASLSPSSFSTIRSRLRTAREDSMASLKKQMEEVQEKCKQLRREGLLEEARRLHSEFAQKMTNELQEMRQRIESDQKKSVEVGAIGELDIEAVNHEYEVLKELITTEYGKPLSEDEEYHADPEYISWLANDENQEAAEILRHCKTTHWQTESTYATLNIDPVCHGQRAVRAIFSSVRHQPLFPK